MNEFISGRTSNNRPPLTGPFTCQTSNPLTSTTYKSISRFLYLKNQPSGRLRDANTVTTATEISTLSKPLKTMGRTQTSIFISNMYVLLCYESQPTNSKHIEILSTPTFLPHSPAVYTSPYERCI